MCGFGCVVEYKTAPGLAAGTLSRGSSLPAISKTLMSIIRCMALWLGVPCCAPIMDTHGLRR